MSDGPTAPPPWIYAMQRYGPPPSYAGMRIPGVTAPIPAGARWGLAHGEWGKPPVDANDHPLWGGQLKGEINAKRRKHHRTTLFGQIQETENETAPLEADETETNAAATHSANAEVTRDQSIAVADTDQSRSIAGQSAVNLRPRERSAERKSSALQRSRGAARTHRRAADVNTAYIRDAVRSADSDTAIARRRWKHVAT